MKSRKRWMGLAVLAAVFLIVGVWLGLRKEANPDGNIWASGTVEATEAQLGFQSPGRIEILGPREGDIVKAGEELARLDRAETMARHQQARAQLDAARAVLRELEGGFRVEEVAQGKAGLEASAERLSDARRDLERTRRLLEGGAVSQEALDKARVAFDVAQSQYDQAEEQMRILESGPRKEKIEAQRAQVAQAEAAVRAMDAILDYMVIRAPFDGLVTVRHREPGEIVPAASPILTLMNPADRWVRIYIPETRIGAVRIGQNALIGTDTFPEKRYSGEVVYIASESEFTPKSVQTAEERVKLVYAVKVRITEDARNDLKPGMPADVRLDGGGPP